MSKQSDSASYAASSPINPSQGHALPAKPPHSQNAGFAFKPRNVSTVASRRPVPSSQSQASSYQQNAHQVSAVSPQGYGATGGYQGYGGFGDGGGYNLGFAGQTQQPSTGFDYSNYWGQQAPPMSYSGSGYGAAPHYDNADAVYQAQMQQWQANYGNTGEDTRTGNGPYKSAGNANNLPLKHNRLDGSTTTPATATPSVPVDPRKTVVRTGGGHKWEDKTLLEWGDHHRLFIGNLAGEVTDDSLLKAFSKYGSVQKARVVRDNRTTKSKGFGFVSFSDADDFFRAFKEMQGKYIGSHPVLIKRSETEIKVTNKKSEHKRNGNKGKSAGGAGGAANGFKKDGVLGAQPGQGIQKKSQKPETKYKLLG